MRRARSQTANTESPGAFSEAISAQNYVSRAQGWIISHGGEGSIIVGPDCPNRELHATPAQWKAWLDYFALIGVPTVFMRKHGVATVPTNWPEEFDATAPSSDPYWTPEPKRPERESTPEERVAMVKRINARMAGAAKDLPHDRRDKTPKGHLRPPPVDLTTPVTLSPEAMRLLAPRADGEAA